MGRTKRKRKEECSDIMGWATTNFRCWVATQKWCRDRTGLARMTVAQARHAAERYAHDSPAACAAARATWFWCAHDTDLGPQVVTLFLCRNMAEVGTRLVLSQDMIFMSCRGQPLGCRDMALSITTQRLHGDLKLVSRHTFWCCDMAWLAWGRDQALAW